MKLYDVRAVARFLDVSERRVRQLRDEKVIAEVRPGLYDLIDTFQSTRPVWGVTAKIHKFLCVFLRKQTKNFIFSKGKPFQNLFYREFIKEILEYGVRTHPGIYVYLCFALHNHRVLRHIRRFTAKMLYLLLILFSQIIKS